MILYTNGDSFLAGSGMAAHLLPGWPGLHDTPSEELYKKNRAWLDSCYSDRAAYRILTEIVPKAERLVCFPNKLKNLLKCSLVNSAEGGSSFDRIARTTIIDLINLKKTTTEPIVAIIGDTDIFRSEVAYLRHNEDTWFQIHLNLPGPSDLKGLVKYKILHERNYQRMTDFYKNWILIKDFCNTNGIELHWIDIGMVQEHEHTIKKHPDLAALKEYANLKASVNMSACAEGVEGKFVPDGHFSEKVHTIVAEKFEKILEKYKV